MPASIYAYQHVFDGVRDIVQNVEQKETGRKGRLASLHLQQNTNKHCLAEHEKQTRNYELRQLVVSQKHVGHLEESVFSATACTFGSDGR